MIRSLLALALLVAAAAVPGPRAFAHDIGVSKLRLLDKGSGSYVLVYLRAAQSGVYRPPALPSRCAYDKAAEAPRAGSWRGQVRVGFRCAGASLGEADRLVFRWPREGILVTAVWRTGEPVRRFFKREGEMIAVRVDELRSAALPVGASARRFTPLGVEHILSGLDHLLFVLGLMLLVRGGWMLVKTITAFTVAHSLTLAAATLGLVEVPPRPVEAAIALSIVFLAVEAVRAQRGEEHLTARHPWIVAFAFGLLHGFGFAGALAELGLPWADIPLALLFFNIGVEIGQLIFVAAVLAAAWAVRRLWPAPAQWAGVLPAYLIGVPAAYWLIERLVAAFGGA